MDVTILAPPESEMVVEQGGTKDLIYEIRNETTSMIQDFDINAQSMKVKDVETREWIKTAKSYCEIILVPKSLQPSETKKFVVRVTIPDDYAEKAFDPSIQKKKDVAFAVQVMAKYKKYLEVY